MKFYAQSTAKGHNIRARRESALIYFYFLFFCQRERKRALVFLPQRERASGAVCLPDKEASLYGKVPEKNGWRLVVYNLLPKPKVGPVPRR